MGAIVVIVSHPSQSAASQKGASPPGGLSVAPTLNPTWPCTSNPPRIDSFPNGVLGLGQDPFPAQLACGPGRVGSVPTLRALRGSGPRLPWASPEEPEDSPKKSHHFWPGDEPKDWAIMHLPDLSLLFS